MSTHRITLDTGEQYDLTLTKAGTAPPPVDKPPIVVPPPPPVYVPPTGKRISIRRVDWQKNNASNVAYGSRGQHEQADDEIVAWQFDANMLVNGQNAFQLEELTVDAELCISTIAGAFPENDPNATCYYKVAGPNGKGGPKWIPWYDTRTLAWAQSVGASKLPTPGSNNLLFVNVRRVANPGQIGVAMKYFALYS